MSRSGQGGVTLIELLIGLAIGVLVILAVFSIMLNLTQASARVVQSADVSGAVRASAGYANRRLTEAGFGISSTGTVLAVQAGSGTAAGNSAQFRSRTVAEPMTAVLPSEIEDCNLRSTPRANQSPILEEICGIAPASTTARTIMTGTVALEVHSGCSTGLTTRVTVYRRGECAAGERRRTVRTAILVRAAAPEPVQNRLVAEDQYTFPSTAENAGGAIYTVPTGPAGVLVGCEGNGDCRVYRHRMLVTESVPRNELLRNGVEF
jgi:Prokaryotic N-terminal methylation motif